MNFRALIDKYPEVLRDRHSLTFSREQQIDEIATAFSRAGVVMLKGALPAAVVEAAGEASCRSSAIAADGWRRLWDVKDGHDFPAATVISVLLNSWAWAVIERLCGSPHIALPLGFCLARHVTDVQLDIGAHQDGFGLGTAMPFSVWIPLQKITPLEDSGLGFVVPAPDHVVPAEHPANVGPEIVLGDPSKLWIPAYRPGDLTIHSNLSPHFTTGYGTGSHRFSFEVRAVARHACPLQAQDPALYVTRQGAAAEVVGSRVVGEIGAKAFIGSWPISDL